MKFKAVLSFGYSITQGLSVAATVGYSVYHDTKNAVAGVVTASGAFLAETVASYWFQGTSMREDNQESTSNTYDTDSSINSTPRENDLLLSENTSDSNKKTVSAELLYTLMDTGKSFANRYFFLIILEEILNTEFSDSAFFTTLFVDLLLKQLFNLSNETYEVCEEISEQIQGEKKPPVYMPIFKPLLNKPRAITFFRTVGSLEHVLMDDLAPWITFLPRDAASFIKMNPEVSITILSLCGLIGIPLTLLIFLQTYLFEGKHTEMHLKDMQSDLETNYQSRVPKKLIDILNTTINIMGPVHGVATAASTFVSLRNLIENPWVKWPVASTVGLLVFVGTTIGVHMSEVKEAKAALSSNPNLLR